MDARLLLLGLIVAGLALSRLIHRFVERPLTRFLKAHLCRAFSRPGTAGS